MVPYVDLDNVQYCFLCEHMVYIAQYDFMFVCRHVVYVVRYGFMCRHNVQLTLYENDTDKPSRKRAQLSL